MFQSVCIAWREISTDGGDPRVQLLQVQDVTSNIEVSQHRGLCSNADVTMLGRGNIKPGNAIVIGRSDADHDREAAKISSAACWPMSKSSPRSVTTLSISSTQKPRVQTPRTSHERALHRPLVGVVGRLARKQHALPHASTQDLRVIERALDRQRAERPHRPLVLIPSVSRRQSTSVLDEHQPENSYGSQN